MFDPQNVRHKFGQRLILQLVDLFVDHGQIDGLRERL